MHGGMQGAVQGQTQSHKHLLILVCMSVARGNMLLLAPRLPACQGKGLHDTIQVNLLGIAHGTQLAEPFLQQLTLHTQQDDITLWQVRFARTTDASARPRRRPTILVESTAATLLGGAK